MLGKSESFTHDRKHNFHQEISVSIVAALVGFLLAGVTVILGNRIGNRWLRYLAFVVGIGCALGVMGVIAGDGEAGVLTGQIFAGLIIAFYVVKSIFFRKKKISN